MERLGSLYSSFVDWFSTVFYTFGIGAIVAAFLAVGIHLSIAHNTVPIWPVSHYTVMWLLAMIFPLTAVLYLIFDLRMRRNQIQDLAARAELHFVYFPAEDEAQRKFTRLLRIRFRESCQPWELAVFSVAAGLIALLGQYMIYWNTFPKADAESVLTVSNMSSLIVFAAFSGAFGGDCIVLLKKYRTFDLYPSTYLQAAIALVLGTLAGSFIVGIYPSQYVSFLAFALGFLTAVNVGFLVNLLRKEVASITGTTLPPDVSGDLERAIQNSEAIESLHNISLYSIAELVKAEPLVIYLNLPQSLGVINGWIDEALLLYYFGDACVRSLSSLYVRRFTQLLEMAIVTWPQTGAKVEGIVWASKLSPGLADEEAARIVAALRGIIGARLHNRLLGILSDKYRVVFFPAAGQTKERLGFSETA